MNRKFRASKHAFKCDPTAAIKWRHKTEILQNGGQALLDETQHGCWTLIIQEASISHAKPKKLTR